MPQKFIFSSESVGEGHPDKVADYISDSILDACLEKDKHSRVACETLVKSNCVVIAGEITTKAHINYEATIRQAIRDIGYTDNSSPFSADNVFITNYLTRQSPDIAQGVNSSSAQGKINDEQGAGDQGLMFGYACDETPEFLPYPIMLAHKLARELANLRRSGTTWIKPDCKTQVAVIYQDNQPVSLSNVVISTQHSPDQSHDFIADFCIHNVIKKIVPPHLLTNKTEFFVNPTGRFVVGGPEGDTGVTGRKIIVDTYGGWARHGGGAFSGKDPSKVDRSAAYFCRWIAKNIVAAGLAKQVELQVAYAIGYSNPTSVLITTNGTGLYSDEALSKAVQQLFSFKPADIIKQLDLLRPIYKHTTHYGHFTKPDLPWEQLNKVEALRGHMKSLSSKIPVLL